MGFRKGQTKAVKSRMAQLAAARRAKLTKPKGENIPPVDTPLSIEERRADIAEKQLQETTKRLMAVEHDLANALDREKRHQRAADAWKQEREELRRVSEDLERKVLPTVLPGGMMMPVWRINGKHGTKLSLHQR